MAGAPIAHSLSPALHRAAYAALGLDWRYDAHEVDEAGLAAFVRGLGPDWVGLSLTMPLKAAVLPLLDEVSEPARTIGAVNTVIFSEGRCLGSNTDAPGLAAALRSHGAADAGSVTVLGGGATGRSALAAAASLRIPRADVVVRSVSDHTDRLAALGDSLGIAVDVHPWPRAAELLLAPLVVSTVPAGVAAQFRAAVPAPPGVLFDVLYAPWPTPLAAAWADREGMVIGGFELLLEQAALQVAAMTGCPAPVAPMRAAGLAALAAR